MNVSFPRRPLFTLGLAAALAGASLAAHAASAASAPAKSREATLGKGKANGPVLSKSQLRDCMAKQEQVRQQNEETLKLQQDLTNDRAEIERTGTAMKADLETLDRTSQEAVDGYNARAAARDKLIDGYQERTPAFNAKVDALKAEREAFSKACEGRRYLEDDFNELKAGK